MVKEVQSWFSPSDGAKLYAKTWVPDEPPRAHLAYLHGFSDRCEIHYSLFPTLASSPFFIQVHSFDQRGWGKSVLSPKQLGDTGTTSLVLHDFHDFVRHVASSIPDLDATPLFIMGHSMGGQETLHYVLSKDPSLVDNRPRLAGYIVEAPYIALDPSSQPWAIKVVAGKIAAKIAPKMKLKQLLEPDFITRSPERNKAWADDELCHDTGTLEGLRDMLQRAADLHTLSDVKNHIPAHLSTTLPIPTLWTHGTMDKVIAFDPSKALFDRLSGPSDDVVPPGIQGKTFKAYEGAYHKIHCEPDGVGEEFARDVARWIVSIVEAGQQRSKTADGDGLGLDRAKL